MVRLSKRNPFLLVSQTVATPTPSSDCCFLIMSSLTCARIRSISPRLPSQVPLEAFGVSALHSQPLMDMTQYHSPMEEATGVSVLLQYHSPMQEATGASVLLPIQMGPHILELEAQQHWMMMQRMTLQTESSNHHPSTISPGVFPQEDSNGMRSSGITSSGGRFSISMLESTPEHKHKEFVTLIRRYASTQKRPMLCSKANSTPQGLQKLKSSL